MESTILNTGEILSERLKVLNSSLQYGDISKIARMVPKNYNTVAEYLEGKVRVVETAVKILNAGKKLLEAREQLVTAKA
jgi:hypothetical protein